MAVLTSNPIGVWLCFPAFIKYRNGIITRVAQHAVGKDLEGARAQALEGVLVEVGMQSKASSYASSLIADRRMAVLT